MSGRNGEKRRESRKTLRIAVHVAEGIDALNPNDETIIDLNVHSDMKVGSVNKAVYKLLQLDHDERLTYSAENAKNPFDLEKTFKECSVRDGDKIYLESGRRKRKLGNVVPARSGKRDFQQSGVGTNAPGTEEVLELVCTTRIFDQDPSLSSPIRRVRVIVCADQLCKNLIEDVSTLWGRTGLKFKCGRTVLQGNKSFEELGVENNAEIVVTGGRG